MKLYPARAILAREAESDRRGRADRAECAVDGAGCSGIRPMRLVLVLLLAAGAAFAATDSVGCKLVAYLRIPGGEVSGTIYGNIGCWDSWTDNDSVSFNVLDVTDPANPTIQGTLSGGSGFLASEGLPYMYGSTHAYKADGEYIVSFDLSDPENPVLDRQTASGGYILWLAVDAEEHYAYAADYYYGIRVYDVGDPDTIVYITGLALPGTIKQQPRIIASDYIAVSEWDSGVAIVDVSNPASPSIAGTWRPEGVQTENLWADSSYIYAGNGANMYVIDITNRASPSAVGSISFDGYVYGVVVSGNYAYVGTAVGLRIIDVTNRASPTEVGHWRRSEIDGDWNGQISVNGHFVYAGVYGDSSGLYVLQTDVTGDTVGVEELGQPTPIGRQLSATIVRGVLSLTGDGRQETGDGTALLDAAGRRVMELQAGPNDVQHLSPGVYFVRRANSVEKVLLTR